MKTTQLTPLCQSCAMPMATRADHGTDPAGQLDEDYCRFCFKDGHFTNASSSMQEMVDLLTSMSDKMHMTPAKAALFARKVLPTLKRWRTSAH